MADASGQAPAPADQRTALRAFSRALGREAHHLRQWPELTWQQLYNWLQFEEGPVPSALAAEYARRAEPGGRSWLRRPRPARVSSQLVVVLEGHGGRIVACAFSPDGALLATASQDHTARLWDSRSGALLRTVPLDAEARSLAFHPASPRLATGTRSGEVVLAGLEGIHYGPLVVTALAEGAGLVARCPACGERFAVDRSSLGTELACPIAACGQRLKVNPFAIQMTRKPIRIVNEARPPGAAAWWQFWRRG